MSILVESSAPNLHGYLLVLFGNEKSFPLLEEYPLHLFPLLCPHLKQLLLYLLQQPMQATEHFHDFVHFAYFAGVYQHIFVRVFDVEQLFGVSSQNGVPISRDQGFEGLELISHVLTNCDDLLSVVLTGIGLFKAKNVVNKNNQGERANASIKRFVEFIDFK